MASKVRTSINDIRNGGDDQFGASTAIEKWTRKNCRS